jgi:hypothetical protein
MERASRSQRQRWEGGRWALVRKHAWPLTVAAVPRRSPVLLDLAADLLVPPLTYVVLWAGAGTAFVALATSIGLCKGWALAPWAFSLGCLGAYIARGVWLAGVGLRALVDLAWGVVYIAWKLSAALRPGPADQWVRTAREGERR